MASDNVQECEKHPNKVAFLKGIRGNFYMEELGSRYVVVKCIKKSSNQQTTYEYMTEKDLQELYHQNIIQIFSYDVVDNYFHIKTEFCNFDLHEYLNISNSLASYHHIDRSQEAKLDILQQIGKGLKYLHNHNKPLIHGNLRPKKVQIKQSTDKITLKVRLSDFHFQGVFIDNNPAESRYCISPEVLADGNNVTTAVDIYAYGCLIHTVLTDSFDESYHPFGKLDDENFLKNVKEGERINKLPKVGDESDFFILADLAIDDCTDAKFKRRPTIDTVLKHPMFWTVRKKELFFHGMYCLQKDAASIELDKMPTFNVGTGNSKNKIVVDYMVNKFKTRPDNSCEMDYEKLVFFIRNTFVHFREREKTLDEEGYQPNILTSGKTEFIRYVIAGYPNLVPDLFKIFRKYFIKHTLDRGECVYHNYNSYFENLGKQILKTTWRSIADKSRINACDIEGLWYEELKPYVAIELAVKFILQLTGAVCDNDKNLFTSIVNYHMPQMSKEYNNFIKYKFDIPKEWSITKPENKSFRYDISDNTRALCEYSNIDIPEIRKPVDLAGKQVYTFSKADFQTAGLRDHYWWLEVTDGKDNKKMHSLLMDSDDELGNILKDHSDVILHRCDITIVNNEDSSSDNLEPFRAIESAVKQILQCTNIDKELFTSIFNEHMPKMSVQYYDCINHKINNRLQDWGIKKPKSNSCQYRISDCKPDTFNREIEVKECDCLFHNPIFFFDKRDTREAVANDYYWWLEVTDGKDNKKMHSFLMDSDDELGNIFQDHSDVILHRCDITIVNNEGSSSDNLEPFRAIESAVKQILQCSNIDKELFTSIVKKHMPKMSVQYYDCINHKINNRLQDWGIKKPKSNSCQYRISDCKPDTFNREIEVKECDCLFHNPIFFFDKRDTREAVANKYYWWLEVECRKSRYLVTGEIDPRRNRIHSFLMDSDDELGIILKYHSNAILHRCDITNVNNKGSSSDNLEPFRAIESAVKKILQYTNIDKELFTSIVKKHMPKMSVQYYDCINHKVNLEECGITKPKDNSIKYNIYGCIREKSDGTIEIEDHQSNKVIYSFNTTDLGTVCKCNYYWWLEFEKAGKKKMHSFLMDDNKELVRNLGDSICFKLHQSKESFKTTTDWKSFPDITIADNGDSSFENLEPYIAIELAVELYIGNIPKPAKKLFTSILNEHMPKVSVQYYDCINHKINNRLQDWGIKKPKSNTNSCQYRISDCKPDTFNSKIEVKECDCLFHNPIFFFDMTDTREALANKYYWWLEVKCRHFWGLNTGILDYTRINKMHSFLTDSDDELADIFTGRIHAILHRCTVKNVNNKGSSSDNLEPFRAIESAVKKILQYTNIDKELFTSIVKKHMPKMSVQYYDCINHKVNLEECGITKPKDNSIEYNINGCIREKSDGTIEIEDHQSNKVIYSFNTTDLGTVCKCNYYWWLEFEKAGKKKMHSFLMDDNKELVRNLGDSICFKLHQSKESFKTTTDWKSFPDITIADNGDSSFENLEPYIAIELAVELYIGNIPKPAKKLFTSILNEHMPKVSVQYYDCINHKINNRLQDWGIKKPKSNTNSCQYRIFDCRPSTFNREIKVKEYDCLCHNPIFFFDKRDTREAVANDYYWWLEVTDGKDNKKMHSFLMDEDAKLEEILDNRGNNTKFYLHRSKQKFGGNYGTRSMCESEYE